MQSLSAVVLTWNRPATLLENSLYTLSNQDDPPSEIVVVEASPDLQRHADTLGLCGRYPLARVVEASWPAFNISRGMNVGIRQARGEFIMATCMEMLFAPGFLDVMNRKMGRDSMVFATCGNLPEEVPPMTPAEAWERWPQLCLATVPCPPSRWSPGAVLCAHRDWWLRVRGYDEARRPFCYVDADIEDRAIRSGLSIRNIEWDESQCIHPYHPPSPLFYSLGGYPPDAGGVDRDVVRNDPERWGEP